MKIQNERLRKALLVAEAVIPKKPAVTSLLNVLVGNGKIVATDLQDIMVQEFPEATDKPFLIPCKVVLDTLKHVPSMEEINITVNEHTLKVSWSDGYADFATPAAADYPEVVIPETPLETGINSNLFVQALNEAHKYSATEASRAVLCGVGVDLGEVMTAGGADGFRLSFQSVRIHYPEHISIVISADTVKLLNHIKKLCPPPIAEADTFMKQITAPPLFQMSIIKGKAKDSDDLIPEKMVMKYGKVTLVSQLVPGKFPDFMAILAANKDSKKISFMGPDLLFALKRMKSFSEKGGKGVKLEWHDNVMEVTLKNGEQITGSSIPIVPVTETGFIFINNIFLEEYLKDKDSQVTMQFITKSQPAFFSYYDKPMVALMPMFMEDKPKEEPTKG